VSVLDMGSLSRMRTGASYIGVGDLDIPSKQ